MSASNMAKRTAAGTLALAICLGGGALALAGASQAAPANPDLTYSGDQLVIASGADRNLVDSVTAGPLAATLGAPVLLTDPTVLDKPTVSTLKSDGACTDGTIWVVGGPAAVGASVEGQLRAICPEADVQRRAGSTRYETAVAVAAELRHLQDWLLEQE